MQIYDSHGAITVHKNKCYDDFKCILVIVFTALRIVADQGGEDGW